MGTCILDNLEFFPGGIFYGVRLQLLVYVYLNLGIATHKCHKSAIFSFGNPL